MFCILIIAIIFLKIQVGYCHVTSQGPFPETLKLGCWPMKCGKPIRNAMQPGLIPKQSLLKKKLKKILDKWVFLLKNPFNTIETNLQCILQRKLESFFCNCLPVCSAAFGHRRFGRSIALGASPEKVKTMAMSHLSPWERDGVRKARKKRNSYVLCNRRNKYFFLCQKNIKTCICNIMPQP